MPTVLVVEDDWVISTLLEEILETEGFEVVSFATADAAWAYLTGSEGKVDLIFSDIDLPGMKDGVDLVNLAHRWWPHIPSILSSGINGQQQLDSGFIPLYVSKPWDSREIGKVCRIAIAGRLEGDIGDALAGQEFQVDAIVNRSK